MDSQRTSTALRGRAKNDVAQLLVRFENILDMAPVRGKDRNAIAMESYQIELETASLIRAAEDLLSLTRSLKETWLFGQLKAIGKDEKATQCDEDAKVAGELLEKWIKGQ